MNNFENEKTVTNLNNVTPTPMVVFQDEPIPMVVFQDEPIPMVVFQDEPTLDNHLIVTNDTQSRDEKTVTTSSGMYNYSDFATEFMAINSIIKIQGILYLYIRDKGYYHPIFVGGNDMVIRKQIPKNMQSRCNSITINEMIKWLNSWINEYKGKINAAKYVNFSNGCLNIETNELYEHSKDQVFTYVLNVDYVYDMKETPYFDQFINNICLGEANLYNLLSEHFGYIISSIRSLKLLTLFYGPSNTGKSTWLELLNMVIGDDFVKSIPLQHLSSNFRTVELVGARLNTCSEVDNFKLNDTYMIKTLSSGGDRINCDVKNGKPIDFINLAALVFASNEIEGLRQLSNNNAIYERLLIIPFLNQIDRRNQIFNLTSKLNEELPYIIKKFALPGLHRLYRNYCNFTDADYIAVIKKEVLTSENSVYQFLEEYCEFGEEYRISTEEMYTYYRRYCRTNKLNCVTRNEFLANVDIADTYFEISHQIIRKRTRIGEDNLQGYIGLRLK